MTIEPYDVYKYYMSLKLHFESDTYDALKYNYKTSAKPQAFFKRRDKYHFAKLGRKYESVNELVNFFIAQFTHSSDNKWIGNMLNDEEAYNQWQRKMQSLSYMFEEDINKLAEEVESFDEMLQIREGDNYPLVVERYMQDQVSLETVVILDRMTEFMKRADRTITETIVWPDVSKRIRKYGLLLRFNEDKIRKIVLRIFTS